MTDVAQARDKTKTPHIAIVGGGLAGLAAATALAGRGWQIDLFEAKQSLGGRAGSFRDPESGELIDHCQHVAMGCCTNFLHFCKQTDCSDLLERHPQLHFFSTDGQRSDFAAWRSLPAPLHLVPTLLGLRYLSWSDKIAISRGMFRMLRLRADAKELNESVAKWLRTQRQTQSAIDRFWEVVLVSALADELEQISVAAARKVFVDGFLAHPAAADVWIPRVSLAELYDQRIARWLTERGIGIHCAESVKQVSAIDSHSLQVQTAERELTAAAVIVAVPWRPVRNLLAPALQSQVVALDQVDRLTSSSIASVHLWTDRPLTELPHAVLVDRLSQWVFARKDLKSANERYYQVVISAASELSGRPKESVIDEVWSDLQAVFPAAKNARLLRARLLSARDAVFREGCGKARVQRLPPQTNHPRLLLAGDWTATGWPATMEGAVRSGYLAAEQVTQTLGAPAKFLQPDLPRGWLARWLIR